MPQRKRQSHILRDAKVRQHMEGLEHEPELVAAQQRQFVIAQRGELPALEAEAAPVDRLEPRDHIEESGLARTGIAKDGDVVAGGQGQVHAGKQLPGPERFPDIGKLKHQTPR